MKVEVFNICDFASADISGRLNLLGVLDTIWAKEKPIIYGICALAVRLRFEKVEEGTKKIKIAFVDADGSPVMPTMETPIQILFPPMVSSATANIVTLIQQIRFPNFGEYRIDLAVDGRQQASTPFYVLQAPTMPPHSQPPLPLR